MAGQRGEIVTRPNVSLRTLRDRLRKTERDLTHHWSYAEDRENQRLADHLDQVKLHLHKALLAMGHIPY